MRSSSPAFWSELPAAPDYSPVREAINETSDSKASAALRLFAGMPPSTGVFANPVRYQETVTCNDEPVELSIRSFAIRGCLFEEDIVTGAADPMQTIFVGLFGHEAKSIELAKFSKQISAAMSGARNFVLPILGDFMRSFPDAAPDVAMQYMASMRKAALQPRGVRNRPPGELLRELIAVHVENAFAAIGSSYMRGLLKQKPTPGRATLLRRTKAFLESLKTTDPFRVLFSLLLRHKAGSTEVSLLQTLGAIQIHHGSAGSNMVARYLASLHTKCVGDIFTAAQMTLDSARHFGAITDLTEFVEQLERIPATRHDQLIRQRAIAGSLPTFGHPEIAAAGRDNRIEVDPRPAIYLSPLFHAIDSGRIEVSSERRRAIEIVQRMYQIAFIEGIEKPGRPGRLRVAPNTDFGAWIVQECLGVDRLDRTLISYLFRGFGWMMDVREQLQQPIIRPVIPPDPEIVPPAARDGVVSEAVRNVHRRLGTSDAFRPAKSASS
jgi:citrate synthase